MFVRRTIETNKEARIRPSKTYQSFVVVAGSQHELSFIERDVKNYITREVWNVSEQDDAKESGKTEMISSQSSVLEATSGSQQREREFDVADFHTVIPCTTKSAIEAQFQHVYTHKKFRKVQTQFREKVNCISRSMHSTLGFTTYEVVEKVSNSTFNKFLITYDVVSREVKCQCLLFESRGILCRHSLSILSFERVDNVAPKYILECRSKNIKRRHTHIEHSQDERLLEPRSKRFDDLVFRLHNICEFTSESEELTGILHRAFDNVMVEIKGKCLLSHEKVTLSNVNDLQSPPRWPKNRLGSNLEKKISNAKKKKKTPALSELKLLDGGPTIQPSSRFYNAPGLAKAADGFGSLIASNARITWSLILFISYSRIFRPYSYLKPSISFYISIKRN
ncbi:hypothetical protein Ahy_B02g058180 [Arachis hypogaea]|uniref:Protein FAR1-RELATED SEQUENCE n=1 Tax=Arachis hypogaea TaxID=3818 RepID=A0A445AE25_ARAHY|nr:hypothetical protein Ahy_B02g058180 [Arachis hypogaea]